MPALVTNGAAIVFASAVGVAFVLVALGIGRRLLIWLRARGEATPLERAAIALVLGAGVLELVVFLLGVAGAFSVTTIRIVSALVGVASLYDVLAVLKAARRQAASWTWPEPWQLAWLAALAPGLVFALLSALTPAIDPDGLGYHLTVPKRWLGMGSLGYLPTYPYSNTPMGVEMLFTLGMAWAGDSAAKLMQFTLGCGAAVALYAAARRLAQAPLAALAVTLLLYGPFGIAVLMGVAYVEAATATALIAAGLAWLIWYRERSGNYLRVAGLLAGVGASSKITAGVLPVALAVLTLVLLAREAREAGKTVGPVLMQLLGFGCLVALPVLPWLLRSAVVTGNPVFPLFAKLISSRDFTGAQSAAFDQYNRYMVWGVGVGAHWGLGMRKAILAAAAGVILTIGLVAYRLQRSFPARATALVLLGTLLLQLSAAGLYKRYWIPILAVAQLPLLLALARCLEAAWIRPAVVVLTGLFSLMNVRQVVQSVNGDVAGLLKTAVGVEPPAEFLRAQLPLLPIYEKLNNDTASDAAVVLAGYCGDFHIDRTTFCADVVQSSLRVSSWSEFTADLKRLGVTHVIAPRSWADPSPTLAEPPPPAVGNTSFLIRYDEQQMVGRIMRDHSRLLVAASDQGLYAIDRASLATPSP